MKAVDKLDMVGLRVMNQTLKLAPLAARIGHTPAFAVVRIVLGRVEISIHAARRAEFEKSPAVRHAPERPEESFYDAVALKNSALRHELAICHSMTALTRFPCQCD